MKGKRVASLLFFVALLFELSSCGIQEEEIVKEDKFYNQKNNIEISLGMTRQEVDRLLTETSGQSHISQTSGSVYYGETSDDHLMIYYDDNMIRWITVDDVVNTGSTSNWCLKDGITKGSSKEEVMRVYGKSTIENEDDEYFAYYCDINNNVLEEVNKDAKYAVAFKMKDGKLDIYEVISLEDNLSEWYTEGTLLTTH